MDAQDENHTRLTALSSLLVGRYRLSKRLVKDALSDMLGVELSVGSVINLEGEMSEALAPVAAEALSHVQAADSAHADDTGFTEGRKEGRAARAWLWVVATALVVVFHIARSRGGKVARQLLGESFASCCRTYPSHMAPSIAPSKASGARTPRSASPKTSVTVGSALMGAAPLARVPRGARA